MDSRSNLKFYKFCLWKAYFEKGYGLTHFLFKLIAVLGLTSQNIKATMWASAIYVIGCFFLGWAWYHYRIIYAEHEVGNRFNMFQQEMRSKIGVTNNRKV